MKKTVLIVASNGSEEMELVITADILRRADIEVTIAGLQDQREVACSRGISLNVDALLREVAGKTFDAVVLPGGQPGSDNLSSDTRVGEILRKHEKEGKLLAAICAAPLAFASHGVAKGGTITCYHSAKNKMEEKGYTYSQDRVCTWKNVVTSQGPGTASGFALKIAEQLVGAEKAESVRAAMLIQ